MSFSRWAFVAEYDRSMPRTLVPLVALAGLAGCNPDEGEPTVAVIVQDAGAETGHDGGDAAAVPDVPCTATNAAVVCASAPFDGQCNMQGFCRRTN